MRAVSIERFGDASGMVVIEAAPPEPGQGQVVIQTQAIGVGGVDAVIRRGTLGGYGFTEGLIPGSEVAGIVTAVGADVDPAWLGRRVWAFTGVGGGYVERALARIGDVVELPDDLSSIDAVTLGSAAPVAHFALQHAHFAAGQSVLVRGAAGSIGIATVELAAGAGAGAVSVTTSSPERGRRLRELGATHVLDRDGDGDATAPTSHDVIIDIVGGPALPAFIDRLAPNGRLVLVGAVAGLPPADFGSATPQRVPAVTIVRDLQPRHRPRQRRETASGHELFAAAARGELHAVVHDVMPLAKAADAHQQMDAGTVFGRIVLVP